MLVQSSRDLADGVTGVMMRLETQERKADMADKDLSAGTAWLLRLCEPIHWEPLHHKSTHQHNAAVELGKGGLFLHGIVKGVTKEKYFDTNQYGKGALHVVTSTTD